MDRLLPVKQGGKPAQIFHMHIIVRDQKYCPSQIVDEENPMSRKKHWFHWILLILMMFSLSSTSTVMAQEADETAVYIIPNVFDVETRSVIAATGALILEVGHDYVLVE